MVVDLFGNYVIQSILQIPNLDAEYMDVVSSNIRRRVFKYSTNMHGCRVMQTCFEVLPAHQKEEMLFELLAENQVKDCCFNFNGNHVVQKIIMTMGKYVNSKVMLAFINVLEGWIIDFSVHEFSCRIVQRMFEYCDPSFVKVSGEIMLRNFYYLSKDEYGIFVLSAMLDFAPD